MRLRGEEVVEVEADKAPGEGEVLLVTVAGSFYVKGSMHDIARRLAEEEWPHLELAEGGDSIMIRSTEVVALRAGSKSHKGPLGFVPR